MGELLDWEPLVWAARISLFTLISVGTIVVFLLAARFLRPDSVWRLLKANLPAVSKLEGEFAGAKGSLEFDAAQSRAMDALTTRVAELEKTTEKLRLVAELATEQLRRLTEPGAEDVGTDRPGP